MSDYEQLPNITEKLVRYGLANGAEETEIFCVKEKRISISHDGEAIDTSDTESDSSTD